MPHKFPDVTYLGGIEPHGHNIYDEYYPFTGFWDIWWNLLHLTPLSRPF